MKRCILNLLLIFTLLFYRVSVLSATMLSIAKDELTQIPSQFRYTMIVLGDNRSDVPIILPETYKRIITEINLIHPTLAINVGDFILGYTKDETLLNQEFTEFINVTNKCTVPFFPVPGNHDVFYTVSEKMYQSLIGELYYSFDYGNTHFICLDTDEVNQTDKIPEKQLSWLKQDLEKTATPATHKFVFLHKPLWKTKYRSNWMEQVHPLLLKHKVTHVFAGHEHCYHKYDIDGIKYIVTGGAGAPKGQHTEMGDFFHYMLVTVDHNDVHLAVVKPGSIEPENIVLGKERDEYMDMYYKVLKNYLVPVLLINENEDIQNYIEKPVTVTLKNPLPFPVNGTVDWNIPSPGWQVTPGSKAYTIPANEKQELTFTVRAAKDRLSAKLPVYRAEIGPIPFPIKQWKVEKQMVLKKVYPCKKSPTPVKIDGKLDEWTGITPIILNKENHIVPVGQVKWVGEQDLSAKIYLSWDMSGLYFATEVRDNNFFQPYKNSDTWRGDGIQMAFDTLSDADEDEGYDDNDYEFGLSSTTLGSQVYCWRTIPGKKTGLNDKIKFTFGKDTEQGKYIYECAIPWTELEPFNLSKDKTIGFTVLVNDNDTGDRERYIEWTFGIGHGKHPLSFGQLLFTE